MAIFFISLKHSFFDGIFIKLYCSYTPYWYYMKGFFYKVMNG